MLEHNLSKQEIPFTTTKHLVQGIYHTIKSFYNSKRIIPRQKALIKKDNKIKYLIAELLRIRGIWKENHKEIIISSTRVNNQLSEFQTHPATTITTHLLEDIRLTISPAP
mmetsp:Transcript_20021/g.19633  ORF Transcript_20021/g.19633 Transcript_20021/m.19633 type:complete len:110 (-) Transcript_20021:20-349(-)